MLKGKRFKLDLQMFNDETGVEVVPEAGEQTSEEQHIETQQDSEQHTEDTNKENVAWAKRIAAEREKIRKEADAEWQSKMEKELEKFKNHDVYKEAAEYLQKSSGINDIMTLKEEIEMQKLQERAEQENLPPEVLKRLDDLEAKAKRADELEEQQNQAKQIEEFETSLKTFAEGKEIDGSPVDYKELWTYMADNEIGNPEIAYKAMKADILESKLAEAKKAGVQEYLASKTGTKTGGGVPTGTENAPAKTIKEAGQRALARIQSMREG